MIVVRSITLDDADAFLALRLQLDVETSFMMYEPGERPADRVHAQADVAAIIADPTRRVLVAEMDGSLVGYIELQRSAFRRNQHCAYLIVGVLARAAGQGIGTRLFADAEQWARQHGVMRLELTVMTHNEAGVALYTRRGFIVEGTRRAAMRVDGQLVDEFYMGKILE